MELNNQQKERLQRVANVAVNASWEGDISGLAFALLRYAGLDVENGYLITSENNKTDIMVEVLVDRHKVLVIECKKDISHPTRLEGYMQDGRFPNGIIMYPLKSIFFTFDIDAEVQQGSVYSNVLDYEEMINTMSQMRIPEFE
jgi:hypothetical protein